jgi:hypothetical protein
MQVKNILFLRIFWRISVRRAGTVNCQVFAILAFFATFFGQSCVRFAVSFGGTILTLLFSRLLAHQAAQEPQQ